MEKKIKINYRPILLATSAVFIISSAWYIIFAGIWMDLRGIDPDGTNYNLSLTEIFLELIRSLVLSLVLAYFVSMLNISNWKQAIQLGIIIWIGFPVILLSGSVLHENVHVGVAAIHAGDWLIKLIVAILILGRKPNSYTSKR